MHSKTESEKDESKELWQCMENVCQETEQFAKEFQIMNSLYTQYIVQLKDVFKALDVEIKAASQITEKSKTVDGDDNMSI